MSDNVTETQEATVTLTVEQLEQIIRKMARCVECHCNLCL